MKAEQICGSWRLVEFKIKKNGLTKDWRRGAHGILIYSGDGYMSVSINSYSEKKEDWIDSVLFYAGKYQIDGNSVIHNVMNATSNDRLNKPMIRTAKVKNKTLLLSAEGDFGKAILKWEKI